MVQFKPMVDRTTRYSRGIECNMLCVNSWKQTYSLSLARMLVGTRRSVIHYS